jgi:hypothetical protein
VSAPQQATPPVICTVQAGDSRPVLGFEFVCLPPPGKVCSWFHAVSHDAHHAQPNISPWRLGTRSATMSFSILRYRNVTENVSKPATPRGLLSIVQFVSLPAAAPRQRLFTMPWSEHMVLKVCHCSQWMRHEHLSVAPTGRLQVTVFPWVPNPDPQEASAPHEGILNNVDPLRVMCPVPYLCRAKKVYRASQAAGYLSPLLL